MRMMLDVRQRIVDFKTATAALVVVTALIVPGSISTSHAADGEIRIGNTCLIADRRPHMA